MKQNRKPPKRANAVKADQTVDAAELLRRGNASTLDRLSRGADVSVRIPSEVERAFHVLAEEIARRSSYLVCESATVEERVGNYQCALRASYARGFYLALLRYADDLKAVPEAAAILKRLSKGPKKGGEATRKKASPKRMDVRRRFRELRKAGFKPTHARRVIHEDTGFSTRQIERDTKGLS
jgi:hypothetical protein